MTDRAPAVPGPAALKAKPSIEQAILAGPILPTILRLAAPNVFTVSVQTAVAIVETWYVGQTGIVSLAALALVFPMLMLVQTTSAGAMGGGVSSSVARALGASDTIKAQALIAHAIVIALIVIVLGGLLVAAQEVPVTWLFAIVAAARMGFAAFAAAAVAMSRWTR